MEGEKVYITEKDVTKALGTVSKTFTIRARNRARDILMEEGTLAFGMGRGAVNMVDPDGTYRSATKEDVIATIKLGQSLDLLRHVYALAYPCDVNRHNVNMWVCQQAALYSDKPYNYSCREDIDIVALSYGTSRREMKERQDLSYSYGHTTAIVHAPLTLMGDDCRNLAEYAEYGIAFHTASIPVACISSPATIAGTIVIQNCENLAPLVLSQLVRPGCPVFYGALAGHADMSSLRPRFGSPEARIMERGGNQMAGYYGLLCRGNTGFTDAPAHDFQAGAQAMLSTLSILEGGPNFLTGCGLLGSYLGGSLVKMVLDTELIESAKRYLTPVRMDEEFLALNVINEVGPGNHFIEHPHTLEHYRDDFLTESLFRSPDYEKWSATGRRDVVHLAHARALRLLDDYRKPPMDQGLEEELEAFVKANWVNA